MERPRLRVAWSDWLKSEPAQFDLQEMLDFCQTLPDGWSVRICNASGRIGGQSPTGLRPGAAKVEFRFSDQPCLETFRQRFAAELAAVDQFGA
jgi:hypothetical protein